MNPETVALSAQEWRVLAEALPEFIGINGIQDHLTLVNMPSGGDIDADGFYAVIEGEVSLTQNGEEIAKLGKHNFFFEEHLALPSLGSYLHAIASPNTKLLKLDRRQWDLMPEEIKEEAKQFLFIGDLVNVHMHDFQQPINCCNITAIAFALTALGFPTHVDDLFLNCKLPSAYVVNDGMTLGEVYNVACTYLHQAELKDQVKVQCYYFDSHLLTPEHLADALCESENEGGSNDILVANFGVGLARNIPNNNGGHFALIAKFNPSSGLIHMIDVHPKKYGKLWVTTIDRLYRAMTQRDSSSYRSRGLLRFTTKNAFTSTLDSLESNIREADMSDYLAIGDHNITTFFRDSTTNLNSLSTAALALRQLGVHQAEVDHLMHTLRLSYTELLSKAPSPESLYHLIKRYLNDIDRNDIHCHLYQYSRERLPNESQYEFLQRNAASVNLESQRQMIVNIDMNVLMGGPCIEWPNAQFSETAVIKQFWCACIDYQPSSGLATLLDSTISTSLVWKTKLELLSDALEDKQDPALILINKKPN